MPILLPANVSASIRAVRGIDSLVADRVSGVKRTAQPECIERAKGVWWPSCP